MMDDNQKKFIPPQASDAEFFSAYLSILGQCKTIGTVGEVWALLHI
jgi:hypothetical protein